MNPTGRSTEGFSYRLPAGIALAAFLGIATFFLWEEHRAHLLGALPWVLLLACPVIHLFMHGGHGHGDGGGGAPGEENHSVSHGNHGQGGSQ